MCLVAPFFFFPHGSISKAFLIYIFSFFKAQEQLCELRQESSQTTVSHNIISLMEKEKELALSDLRRIMAEKEALKEKLQVSYKINLFLKGNLWGKGRSL